MKKSFQVLAYRRENEKRLSSAFEGVLVEDNQVDEKGELSLLIDSPYAFEEDMTFGDSFVHVPGAGEYMLCIGPDVEASVSTLPMISSPCTRICVESSEEEAGDSEGQWYGWLAGRQQSRGGDVTLPDLGASPTEELPSGVYAQVSTSKTTHEQVASLRGRRGMRAVERPGELCAGPRGGRIIERRPVVLHEEVMQALPLHRAVEAELRSREEVRAHTRRLKAAVQANQFADMPEPSLFVPRVDGVGFGTGELTWEPTHSTARSLALAAFSLWAMAAVVWSMLLL